jgi:hypothetical protein
MMEFAPPEEWVPNLWRFDTPEQLARLQKELDTTGPIILQHWFYNGASSPDRCVFEDFENLMEYLSTSVRPGDSLEAWSFAALCRDDNTLADGKWPNADGCTPKNGAY